eukprot:Skav229919  [mRNA]  locus=scaffold3709:10405:15534:- [translate_table: standard]
MIMGCGALQTKHDVPSSNQVNSFSKANFDGDAESHHVHYAVLKCANWNVCPESLMRVGEASNPGPDVLRLGTFNPGQLLGHEQTVTEWGSGIWCASETSHTVTAQKLSAGRLRKAKMNSLWSPPVPCHSNNTGSMRGKASGVAILTHLPVVPYPALMSDDIAASSRLVEGLVDLGAGVTMYVASVYGPTHNATYFDPWSILASLCTCAFEHAHAFNGPAVVVGDFNVDLQQLPCWDAMAKRGWVDAAFFDATRRGQTPKATSRGNARKSFILVNHWLLQALLQCDVMETYDFDTHPLLIAEFGISSLLKPRCVWNLPASTDDFFFDDSLLQTVVAREQECRRDQFEHAMRTGDSEEALRQINLTFETAMQEAVVDTDGTPMSLPRRCLGRSRKKLRKLKCAADPVLRVGRSGDYTPQVCQPSIRIRQWTRQVRRLQSCFGQINACVKLRKDRAEFACDELWRAICHAPGFPQGFQTFALETMSLFVPSTLPCAEYVKHLADSLKIAVADEVRHWNSEVQAARLVSIKRDFQKGGKHAFQSVKDPQAPPFQAVVHEVQVTIIPQRWTKGGLSMLLFSGDLEGFDLALPVFFQNQEAFIRRVHENCLYLDRRVTNRDYADRRLWQRHTVSDIDELHKITAGEWSSMWQREPVDDCEDKWPDAIANLRSLVDIPSLDYVPLEIGEWRRHASTTKKSSARGACAYTPRELLFMPESLCQWLLDLMSAIELGTMQWPPSIMSARVVMLTKPDETPTHPLQVRPITITSRIYRTWAKYRSLQIFHHFQALLPPEIAGTAAGVSADMLAAVIADEVEDALTTQMHRLGLTVDLVKCYNQVPRIPILAALRKLGIPYQYINAVRSMFSQLDRILEIAGHAGSPVASTAGIPEGCCFSIVSMMALTVWATQHIECSHPDVECLAYADNWAVITHCVNALQAAAITLQDFVAALKMKISPTKSWVWATHAVDRRKLGGLHIDGQRVPLKLVATELGCDVTYCKKVSKKVITKRLTKAKRVLKRVATRKLPRKFKMRMTGQLSTGIAGYGSELVYVTPTEFKSLRAATCQAIGRSRGGVNPFLALNVPSETADPELALLRRKCNFWRRFLKAFPYRREAFFAKLAAYDGGRHAGPASVFAKTLLDHGWVCIDDGWVQHPSGLAFNWYYSSRSLVVKMLRIAWQKRWCDRVQSRKHFDISNVDVGGVNQALKSLPDDIRCAAVDYLVGKNVTFDALGHYANGGGSFACPLCGMTDGREHRLLHCTHLAAIRGNYPGLLEWLALQPTAVLHFGLLPWDTTWLEERCAIDVLPKLQRPLPGLAPEVLMVFTDGSAFFTECFTVSVAAGAWIIADGSCITDEGAALVPGTLHNAYRGEIWAVVLALQRVYAANIHSDCSAVCSVGNGLVAARLAGSPPIFLEHADLWSLVWELILTRPAWCVKFTKVKAHQDTAGLDNVYDIWCAKMNNYVDGVAKRCAKSAMRGSIRARERYCKQRITDIGMLRKFYMCWGEMNRVVMTKVKESKPVRTGTMPVFSLLIDSDALQSVQCTIPDHVLHTCPYGSEFAFRVRDYLDGLEWDLHKPAVSLLELYFDFTLRTGTVAPVFCAFTSLRGSRGVYKLPDVHIVADLQQQPLHQQSRVWNRTIKWFLTKWSDAPWGHVIKTASLGRYGYTIPVIGLQGQPRFRMSVQVCQQLWTYFHPNSGSTRNLKHKWIPPRTISNAGG